MNDNLLNRESIEGVLPETPEAEIPSEPEVEIIFPAHERAYTAAYDAYQIAKAGLDAAEAELAQHGHISRLDTYQYGSTYVTIADTELSNRAYGIKPINVTSSRLTPETILRAKKVLGKHLADASLIHSKLLTR